MALNAAITIGRPVVLERGPWKTLDPFLFCVYHNDQFPKGVDGTMGPERSQLRGRHLGSDFSYQDGWSMYHGMKVPGFPQHPHRGFETITVPMTGLVDHFDSLGATGRYGHGDVQWLTTGNGVQHSEMFPLVHEDKPNPLELFQLWLNLPAKSKKADAHFAMFWKPDVPVRTVTDAAGFESTLTVIAGEYSGTVPPSPPPDSWAAQPKSDVAVWIVRIPAGGSFTLPAAAEGTNRMIYYFKGSAKALFIASAGSGEPEAKISHMQGQQLAAAKECTIKASDDGNVEVLLLQGRPIGEPVAQHGPFVMNTREEIAQTFNDYQRTQFGGWPWPSADYTHPINQGRFAKRPDGSVEKGPSE